MSKKKNRKVQSSVWLDKDIDEINAAMNEEFARGDNPEELPLVDDTGGTKPKKPKKTGFAGRCLDTHPVLDIDESDKTLPGVRGGACGRPAFKKCDVYIGFDHGMTFTSRQFPWMEGHEIQYLITDRAAPKDAPSFLKLVDWTIEQIVAGKKIHAGCIGGHGRTGLFFAALVARHTGRADAITYVRENYCQRAVESKAQIEFLAEHYGCDKVKPSKAPATKYKATSTTPYKPLPAGVVPTYPIQNASSVWGRNATWEDDS